MAFQNLNNLPTLQIPQIDLPVLTARNYPFPTRHAETSDDAVFGVLVTRVSFEATRGLVVPQSDRVVVCGGENVFGVW